MTEADDSKPGVPAANTGVKKGLPARSLKDAEGLAAKVWEAARRGTAPSGAVAVAFGLKGASGGAWARSLALLRAFGLVKVSGDNISLSELGLAIVQDADPAARQAARYDAFLKVRAYRELVEGYDGEDLPPLANIASKLRFDYGKTGEMAQQAAAAFVDSLTHAGLLHGTVVRNALPGKLEHAARGSEPSAGPETAEEDVEVDASNQGTDDEEVADALDAAWDDNEDATEFAGRPSGTAAISLSVSLDLSRFRADEVIEILRALGVAR